MVQKVNEVAFDTRRLPREGKRTVFRGFGAAFAALGVLQITEFVAAVWVGGRVFGESPSQIYTFGDFTAVLPGWLLLPLIWIGSVVVRMVLRKTEMPTHTLLRLVRFRSDWLIRGMIVLAGYILMTKSFSVLKSAIPALNPYYLDPALVRIDATVLGMDAWRLTHAISPPWLLVATDRLYALWFTYVVICTGIVSFTRNPRLQIQSAIAFHLCWFGLGNLLATLMASVGPVFYDAFYHSTRFAELNAVLSQTNEHTSLAAMFAIDYLLDHRGETTLGAGISAMPSLHVSMAYFGLLLAVGARASIWIKVLTAGFTFVILFGSVHLGWHYLSDGIVAIVLTTFIWIGAGCFVNWSRKISLRSDRRSVTKGDVHALRKNEVG